MSETVLKYAEGVKNLLMTQSFYFSYYVDLTSNLQLYSLNMAKSQPKSIFWYKDYIDTRYQWNLSMA